jgi:Uri superfamily endonuclease
MEQVKRPLKLIKKKSWHDLKRGLRVHGLIDETILEQELFKDVESMFKAKQRLLDAGVFTYLGLYNPE